MDVLQIGGMDMPIPKLGGLTIKPEKIWSAKTGRGAGGEMLGDLVAVKITLQIQWPPLTEEEVSRIDQAISPAYFDVSFKNPRTAAYETRRFYAGTPTYPVYSYARGIKTYQGVAVNLIEK